MIPNGQPSSLSRQPYWHGYAELATRPPRPQVPEDMLKALAIQVERKMIVVKLSENRRGRFVRIQEENEVKRNCVIIPVSGLGAFKRLIEEIEKANSEIPAKSQNGVACSGPP
jgi:PurA ssDNA and RNA-binding protein